MNDRAVFVVLNTSTGQVDHVWEAATLPEQMPVDEVPVVVEREDASGNPVPSPDHVAVRVLDGPDFPDDLEGLSLAAWIRENCELDGAPLDISESSDERLPGREPMPADDERRLIHGLAATGVREGVRVPQDPREAARKLRYVGALKRREA